MEVKFPADFKLSKEGITIMPADFKEEVRNFLIKHHKWEEKQEQQIRLEVTLQAWHPTRTYKQNNLQWEIAQRIAQATDAMKNDVHDALKEIHYPRREDTFTPGGFRPKDGSEMSTVEYAKVVEAFTNEALMRGAKIRDIWILFTQWRWQQKGDPLEGTYGSPQDYKELHPCCEACGQYLLDTLEGEPKHLGELCHIIVKGMVAQDGDWNWFVFCTKCHRETQHQKGWDELVKSYSWVEPKILSARARNTREQQKKDPPAEIPPDKDVEFRETLDRFRGLADEKPPAAEKNIQEESTPEAEKVSVPQEPPEKGKMDPSRKSSEEDKSLDEIEQAGLLF